MEVEGTDILGDLTSTNTGREASAWSAEAGLGLGSAHMESEDSKRAKVVQSEVDRVKLLPASSAYAVHRLRVLNKMLELLKVDPSKRTKTEIGELELLFAGMSF